MTTTSPDAPCLALSNTAISPVKYSIIFTSEASDGLLKWCIDEAARQLPQSTIQFREFFISPLLDLAMGAVITLRSLEDLATWHRSLTKLDRWRGIILSVTQLE